MGKPIIGYYQGGFRHNRSSTDQIIIQFVGLSPIFAKVFNNPKEVYIENIVSDTSVQYIIGIN
jgi:hypothetical protein